MAHRNDGDGAPPAHNDMFKLRKLIKSATRHSWNGERKCETLDLHLDRVADTRVLALTGLVLKYIEIFSLRGELGCTQHFKYKIRFQKGAKFVQKQPKY